MVAQGQPKNWVRSDTKFLKWKWSLNTVLISLYMVATFAFNHFIYISHQWQSRLEYFLSKEKISDLSPMNNDYFQLKYISYQSGEQFLINL